MLKFMIALCAAVAMSVSASAASPLNGTLMVKEKTGIVKTQEVEGIFGFLLKQVNVSLVTAVNAITATPDETEEPPYSYSNKDECEAERAAGGKDSEPEESTKKEPVGPEPIYFGF